MFICSYNFFFFFNETMWFLEAVCFCELTLGLSSTSDEEFNFETFNFCNKKRARCCYLAGHYLSASAQMWASTHNKSLKEKMTSVVSYLSACQEKIGTGYLSAFPSEQFDRFEAIKPVWAPYYTIHKVEILSPTVSLDATTNPCGLKSVLYITTCLL